MNVIQKIAKARGAFEEIVKSTSGYDYRYADLDAIMKAVNPGLIEQGLHVYHTFETKLILTDIPYLLVTCHISDGESELTNTIPLSLSGIERSRNTAQEMGKLITYGRRYSIAALLCLTAEEDTDAQTPEQRQRVVTQDKAVKQAPKQDIEAVKAEPKKPWVFEPSEKAHAWLDKLLDEIKVAQDVRPAIRDQAPGKTVSEIKQIALGVINGSSTTSDNTRIPIATGPIKRSPQQASGEASSGTA